MAKRLLVAKIWYEESNKHPEEAYIEWDEKNLKKLEEEKVMLADICEDIKSDAQVAEDEYIIAFTKAARAAHKKKSK